MSKQRRRNLGDLDKRIKPYHVADKPLTLTIAHVGIETIKSQFKPQHNAVEVLAGDTNFNPFAGETEYRDLYVLWFKETGSRVSFPLNNTNRRTLIKLFGKEFDALIGKRITLKAGKAPNGADTVLIEMALQVEPAQPIEPEHTPSPVCANCGKREPQCECGNFEPLAEDTEQEA